MDFICNKNLDINDLNKPLVISYDNEIKEETKRFIDTLENHNWDYMIVGKGEKWEGFITKIIKYNKVLKTLHPNKIVILSDARDVYCLRTQQSFIEAFNTFGGKTIVSAEVFLNGKIEWSVEEIKTANFRKGVPITNYWTYHNITNLPFRKYVNSGLIAGKVLELIEQTNWQIQFSLKNNIKSDQLTLTHYINEYPEKIILDSDANILHSTTFGVNAGIENVHIQKLDSPTLAEFFGRSAFFLHIPGTTNKGQRAIYNYSWKIIELGICSKELLKLYNYPEIAWNEIF